MVQYEAAIAHGAALTCTTVIYGFGGLVVALLIVVLVAVALRTAYLSAKAQDAGESVEQPSIVVGAAWSASAYCLLSSVLCFLYVSR